MKTRETDDLLIHHMLEETYRFTPERESGKNSPDLFAYFYNCEKNAEDFSSFLKKEKIESVEVNYLEENSCFRFTYNNQVFDFPVNWSFFHQLFISWQISRNDCIALENKNDETSFAEVFNLITPYTCDFLFCISEQKIYFVAFPEGNNEIRSKIEKKLGLTNEGPIQKAA